MSAVQMIVSGVAGRYAAALFDLARQESCLDTVEGELASVRALVGDNPDFGRLIASPLYRRDEQTRAIVAIAGQAGLSGLTTRFLGVVAENHRLSELLNIVAAFDALLADHRGEINAEVTAAQPLNEGQLAAIRDKLGKFAGREVNVAMDVDASLLGGMVVKLGSRMIDSSLKTKIAALQLAMKEGG